MRIQLDLTKTPFSLSHTLSCGQTFRWQQEGDRWVGVVRQEVLKVRQSDNDALEFAASADDIDSGFVRRYFRLDDNLPEIYLRISKDGFVRQAVKGFRGLRLLRQEPWECLISYICATFKNIPAIKQMVYSLSKRFGTPIQFEGVEFYGFPECRALAEASLPDLRRCGLGYRASYVRETARAIDRGKFDLESLRDLPYEFAKKKLMCLPGVGSKVADCVLLFSLDKLEAFPIDVWMKRIVLEYYSQYFESAFVEKMRTREGLSRGEYQAVYAFGREYFGEFVGYAQEYLYHYKRCLSLQG
ncbi:MAG TPA: DNA glycosylase [Candidatus Bathyarchaeia archaeon]|nr:DNA glycosylase [Candidatus Bathyarchaeia archaeon]